MALLEIPGSDWQFVTEQGVVHRLEGNAFYLVKLRLDKHGYLMFTLVEHNKKSRPMFVHHAVLAAFVGPRPIGHEASHLNHNKTDNRVENLRWETHKENMTRSWSEGRMPRGEDQKGAKLTGHAVVAIRYLCDHRAKTQNEIAKEFGISSSVVGRIALRQDWPHIPEQKSS